jgi:hypothetical protein
MAKVMMVVEGPGRAPTVSEAAGILRVDPVHLDATFGVVLTDPKRNLYTVLVDEEAAGLAKGGEGPYSNPPISTFGPRR